MELKLRTIVGGTRDVKGFTVPSDVSMFFPDCYFTIEKSGTCIVFYSGARAVPTVDELENYTYGDCNTGSIANL